MITTTRKWFRRHKTPIIIGTGVIGLGYITTQYFIRKILDARERMNNERIARENLRRRFEQNQEDCTLTVLALLPIVVDNLFAELETEKITLQLQQQKAAKLVRAGAFQHNSVNSELPSVTDEDERSMASLQSDSGIHASQVVLQSTRDNGNDSSKGGETTLNRLKSKLQLWNDLKISAITRSFTLIYTLALLNLFIRIQLNLLGRRSYLSSVASLATSGADYELNINLENYNDNSEQVYSNDSETNKMYLIFSWWLLHRGWRDVMVKVEAAVREIFGNLSLRDELSIEKFSKLTLEVRKKVEGSTPIARQQGRWLRFLLPPVDQEEIVFEESGIADKINKISSSTCPLSVNTALRRLLDETSDLVDTPLFSHVLTLLLDAGFSVLVDQKISEQAYKIPPISQLSEIRVQEVMDVKPVKLPIILAVLTRQAHVIGNGSPNEYLEAMDQTKNLEAFAAVIYTSNWEDEICSVPAENVTHLNEQRDLPNDLVKIPAKQQECLIDVDTASKFESIWGKVVDKVEKVNQEQV